jgi:hypothetical protein
MTTHKLLLTVRLHAYATWRYAIGHERAGEISRVERYENTGAARDYVLHRPTNTVRRFG